MAGLREVRQQTGELRQVDGIDLLAALDGVGDGVEVEVELLGVELHIVHFPILFLDAGLESLTDGEQRPLTEALHVGDLRNPFGVGHALHLDTGAARTAHIHVLATRADARAHTAGAAVQEADDVAGLLHLVGIHHVGVGDCLNQRHAQTVGAVDTGVPDVGNLAAGVFFHAELDEAHLLVAQRNLAVDAEDGGALETRRDGTVEILFAGDVDLAHDLQLGSEGNLEGVLQSLGVDRERRGVVDLVRARGAVRDAVDDVLARLELHERGAVVFAHLR